MLGRAGTARLGRGAGRLDMAWKNEIGMVEERAGQDVIQAPASDEGEQDKDHDLEGADHSKR